MSKDFEQIPHTADLKIRVYGKDKKQLFRHALIGMFQVIRPITQGCTVQNDRTICTELPIQREIKVSAIDEISLLVDFLSEALYLSDVHDEAYLDVIIDNFSSVELKAVLLGVKIKRFDGVEIKAVTYHDLHIEKKDDEWVADIVFDI